MTQALVIANPDCDASGKAIGKIAHCPFQARIPRAKDDQSAAAKHEVGDDLGKKIYAFLICQTTDDDGQRAGDLQPEFVAKACARRSLSRHCLRTKGGVFSRRVPNRGIDPIEDTRYHRRPCGDHTLQPHAKLGPHQFSRIGRRDGGYPVRGDECRLQAGNAAVVFQRLGVEGMARQAQDAQHVRRRPALEGNVVDGDDRLHTTIAMVGKVSWCKT
jgi:hypothetical protein